MNSDTRHSALTARTRRYLTDAAAAFGHAPVEVALSVLLAVAFSYTIASDAEPFPEWLEFAVIVVLAGASALVATLLHALGAWSARTRWIATAAGAVAAALHGLTLLDLELEAEAWRAAGLVAAAALLVLAAPALAGRAGATERFRRVTGRLLLRFLAVLLYAAALFAGLALALGAVNTLFELDLDARIYAHVLGWIFLVLVTWVVIGGLPDYVRPAEEHGSVARAVHRMSAFLVTPLLAIYYLILYAYALRIALTGELPKNLVSPLVIAAGLIAGLALTLFDRDDDRGASFRSLRSAAPLFMPLGVLGIWAIALRLDQYGWTEFRALRIVLLTVLGLLAAGAVVLVLRRRSLPLHLLPLTLAAALVLAVVGPWSVMAVSRRSQQHRLAAAMIGAGLDWEVAAVRDSVIPTESYREISATSRYLATHFGRDALPPLFARQIEREGVYVDVVQGAGLRPARPDLAEPRGGFAQLSHGAVFGDSAGGALHYIRLDRPARTGGATDTTRTSLTIPIQVGGTVLHADLTRVAGELATRRSERSLPPEAARVVLRDASGEARGELYVLEIGIGGDDRGPHVFRLVAVARLNAAAGLD